MKRAATFVCSPIPQKLLNIWNEKVLISRGTAALLGSLNEPEPRGTFFVLSGIGDWSIDAYLCRQSEQRRKRGAALPLSREKLK